MGDSSTYHLYYLLLQIILIVSIALLFKAFCKFLSVMHHRTALRLVKQKNDFFRTFDKNEMEKKK